MSDETGELGAGTPGPMMVDVPVRGLHCVGCVARLTKVLELQTGVAKADVSLLEQRARLTLETPDALATALAAIESAGFYPGQPGAGLTG
jgi:Cu+-exporting ATPase